MTKGVQQQATYEDHRKKLRGTVVVGEMAFKLYEGKYNIQLTDRTRSPKETEKEDDCVPDLAPSDTRSQWSCSGSVLEKPKPESSNNFGTGCMQKRHTVLRPTEKVKDVPF